ncbi:MAG: hypothetical protein J6F30_12820 [Cellulosilyticum sp.]|nr:hypothetical protein [Cellulosilyticum sp.]
MNSTSNHFSNFNNTVFMMDQELKRAMENQQKRLVKTKKVKVTKKKEVENQTHEEQDIKNKNSNVKKKDHAKVYNAEQARKEQFEKVEARRSQGDLSNEESIGRLREAMILAEIVGKPRCRDRHARRMRRD